VIFVMYVNAVTNSVILQFYIYIYIYIYI